MTVTQECGWCGETRNAVTWARYRIVGIIGDLLNVSDDDDGIQDFIDMMSIHPVYTRLL